MSIAWTGSNAFTPEQIAHEKAEHEKWLNDPAAQARYAAFKRAFGIPDM